MNQLIEYQLFLFDFDGLLVNSEEIHYCAYKKMCADRGFTLPWDFNTYCFQAHYDADKLRNSLYADLPGLHAQEPCWDVLYAEKKHAMIALLNSGAVHLMPGVETLLNTLKDNNISSAVVTNSPKEQINIILEYNPILKTIPHWFTRETYSRPKPDPECYLNAIEKIGADSHKIIGFEDTPRGLKALLQTRAKPIFISQVPYPEIPDFKKQGVMHFSTLTAFFQKSAG